MFSNVRIASPICTLNLIFPGYFNKGKFINVQKYIQFRILSFVFELKPILATVTMGENGEIFFLILNFIVFELMNAKIDETVVNDRAIFGMNRIIRLYFVVV